MAESIDRRALLKKSALATGAVWVTPMVLTSSAGAANETCHVVKHDTGTSSSGTATATNNPDSCLSVSNVSGGGSASVAYSNPKDGNEWLTATVTVPAGCQIRQIALKAGGGGGNSGAVCIAGNNGQSQSVTSASQGISHVTVFYCCPAAGS